MKSNAFSLVRFVGLCAVFILVQNSAAFASGTKNHYADFTKRNIKSLSNEDIAALQAGSGWGLALPAELNGWPGPKHVLELKSELDLSEEQIDEITAIFQAMQKQAITAGETYIEAEEALSRAFEHGHIDEARLSTLLSDAATARGALRNIHLSAHLTTPAILTPEQIQKYNQLRGYTDDPCASVPEGHDPNMWRKHNGCD